MIQYMISNVLNYQQWNKVNNLILDNYLFMLIYLKNNSGER